MLGLMIIMLGTLYALLRRNYFAAGVLSIPLLNIFYFVLSTRLFAFGETLPFTYYDPSKAQIYDFVLLIIALHFIAVFIAMKAISKLSLGADSCKSYSINRPRPGLSRSLGALAFVVCISPVVFVLVSADISELLWRQHFIIESAQHGWMRFTDLSFFLSAGLTPFLRRPALRFAALVLVVVAFASIGSRAAPVMVFVFVLVDRFIIGSRSNLLHATFLAIGGYLLVAVLGARLSDSGGLITIFNQLTQLNMSVVLELLSFGINYMCNYSIVINGEMLLNGQADTKWFTYGILPIPSFVHDMTLEYDAENRFRKNVPYPGFGYALLYLGGAGYLGVVFVTSLVFFIGRALLISRRDAIDRLFLFIVLVCPFLILLQYNLRGGMRLLYFFTALYFAFGVARRMRFSTTVSQPNDNRLHWNRLSAPKLRVSTGFVSGANR